ncbi:MAG TPA: YjgN family protein, partial [Methylibium sp.]
VRKLRYFYGNTRIAGHAFDFHGNPRRMLRGYLLVGALIVLYSVAGKVSPTAGLVALVIVAVIWPALLRASMQFRLANTSWRGLRFRFTGSTAQAYRAVLPLFIPALLFLGIVPLVGPQPGSTPATASEAARTMGGVMLAAGLIAALVGPWAWWLLKRYQHDHYALGDEQTRLRAGVGPFYALSLKTGGIALLMGLVLGVLGAIGGAAMFATARGLDSKAMGIVAIAALVAGGYILLIAVVGSYSTSRTQNLVWTQTASPHLRFKSDLRFGALLRLTLMNWLLVALTLGFYWPFAKVAMTRLRLEAIRLGSSMPIDTLANSVRQRADDASGDAAGELFGIDIGL